jgi:hypothetical protein
MSSACVRAGTGGSAARVAGAPVHPAKALVASARACASDRSPATTSSAPCGRRRAVWNATTSARVMAFTVASVALRP